jgi:hypothetical protein
VRLAGYAFWAVNRTVIPPVERYPGKRLQWVCPFEAGNVIFWRKLSPKLNLLTKWPAKHKSLAQTTSSEPLSEKIGRRVWAVDKSEKKNKFTK